MKAMSGIWLALALTACASAPPPKVDALSSAGTDLQADKPLDITSIKDKALEFIGLKKEAPPELPDAAKPEWRVTWQLRASPSLNITPSGQSLATVVRLYKLRSPNAFLQTPYDVFGDVQREKQAFGEDLVEVKELRVLPGQAEQVKTKVAREAAYVGIVALFREPAAQRWRYAFDTAAASGNVLTLGLHACAMSVQTGMPIGIPTELARSVAVSCS